MYLWVRFEKLLGFYLTERGVETNSDKCEALIKMEAPIIEKEVTKLNGC